MLVLVVLRWPDVSFGLFDRNVEENDPRKIEHTIHEFRFILRNGAPTAADEKRNQARNSIYAVQEREIGKLDDQFFILVIISFFYTR